MRHHPSRSRLRSVLHSNARRLSAVAVCACFCAEPNALVAASDGSEPMVIEGWYMDVDPEWSMAMGKSPRS